MLATESKQPDSLVDSPNVAVVYFHGMGDQRRFEEVSRLVDAIDTYLEETQGTPDDDRGCIRGIGPEFEMFEGEPIAFIRTRHLPRKDCGGPDKPSNGQESDDLQTGDVRGVDQPSTESKWEYRNVDFFSTYWAPVMARHSSASRVLSWLFRQIGRPFQTMGTPWRERQRLRRSELLALMERPRKEWPEGVTRSDFGRLLRHYHDYESPDAIRRHRTGSIDEFVDYLRVNLNEDSPVVDRCVRLAKTWERAYRFHEWRNAVYLLTIAVGLVLAVVIAIAATVAVVDQFIGATVPRSIYQALGLPGEWGALGTAIVIALVIVWVMIIGAFVQFLTDYMGDVESWVTYEETDQKHERRREVIDRGLHTLRYVLGSPEYSRVVIVSHSLGTAIAHDCLLEAARHNRASKGSAGGTVMDHPFGLRKIRHFITLGSPIDKIQYFFESYQSKYHRYRRVVEQVRGDMGTIPFTYRKKPHVRWVNFWDQDDVISGALHSTASAIELDHLVENVHVTNLNFPTPGAAHSAYFRNKTVIGHIFEMAYRDRIRIADKVESDERGVGSNQIILGHEPHGSIRRVYAMAMSVPWLLLLGLGLQLVTIVVDEGQFPGDGGVYIVVGAMGTASLWTAAILVGGLVVEYIGRAVFGSERHRNSISSDSKAVETVAE